MSDGTRTVDRQSALRGVIGKLQRGERLSDEAIAEIERILAALQAEGWAGGITADEAVRTLANGVGR